MACVVGSVSRMSASSSSGASVAGGVLPVEQYVAGLARKRMAAGVLFRDSCDRVLLVEPSYKPNWEIPGGAVEAEESPWQTAERELEEEIGFGAGVGGCWWWIMCVRRTTGRKVSSLFSTVVC